MTPSRARAAEEVKRRRQKPCSCARSSSGSVSVALSACHPRAFWCSLSDGKSGKGNAQPFTPADVGKGSAGGLSAEELATAIDKRRKPVVQHIDMQPKLKASTLEGLAHEVLPRSEVVDELGSELKLPKDSGVASPFPFVELKRFMPPWIVIQ